MIKSHHPVVLEGNVSNSFQLIGILAAQNKISLEHNTNVYLDLKYTRYWNKSNISENIIRFIKSPQLYSGNCTRRTVRLNHSRIPFGIGQIILDDGIGAYRKNLLEIIRTDCREASMRNKTNPKITYRLARILSLILKQVYSFIPINHVSMFRKTPIGYFTRSKRNIPFFHSAISRLSEICEATSPLPDRTVLLLTQPYKSIGFQNIEVYYTFLKKAMTVIASKYPNSHIVLKRHPVDDCNYSNLHIPELASIVPAEVIFERNKGRILATLGFNSTSMLSGSVLFGIPAISLFYSGSKQFTRDFWVNRAFDIYTEHVDLGYV